MTDSSDKANLHLKIAVGYIENEKYPQALNELLIAKKLDPSNAAIYNNLGIVYFARKKNELSLANYRKSLKLSPNYTEARNNYSLTLMELKKWDEAEAELKIAVEDLTYNRPFRTYTNLGRVYFEKKKYADAIKYLEYALQDQKSDCTASTLYGRALFEMSPSEISCSQLDRAAINCLKTNNESPQYYAALCFYKIGSGQKAQARLHDFVKQYPSSKYAHEAKSILNLIK